MEAGKDGEDGDGGTVTASDDDKAPVANSADSIAKAGDTGLSAVQQHNVGVGRVKPTSPEAHTEPPIYPHTVAQVDATVMQTLKEPPTEVHTVASKHPLLYVQQSQCDNAVGAGDGLR